MLKSKKCELPSSAHLVFEDRKIRVAIAEDFVRFQEVLITTFSAEPDIEIVVIASNGVELLTKLKVLNQLPDIILMDIRMPLMDGIEATSNVTELYPTIKVVAFSAFDDSENIIAMYMHGAKGFVSKDDGIRELIHAIRMIYTGVGYVTNEALAIIQRYLHKIKLTEDQQVTLNVELVNQLSAVELKLLYHTAQFKSLNQLAEILHKSPATINNQQAHLRHKLGLKGRKSLLQFAVRQLENIKYMLKIRG